MVEISRHFCTCTDLSCKLNPHNNSNGSDLCIKKNLKLREIPICFFKLINDDIFIILSSSVKLMT